MSGRILGIDPGTRKAGYAVLACDDASVLELGIETVESLLERARLLVKEHEITAVALGTGTNAGALGDQLAGLGVPVQLVDERETTLKARALYFADHPPQGWRRLVPLGMQLPPRPIDDYAAVLIGRRYLEEARNSR
jgi:RNase H-fold protein (predicted Holliday junction resolvase)